jgi:hypothetical protein
MNKFLPSSPKMTAVQMVWRTRSGHEVVGPWVEHEDYETALDMARSAAAQNGWPGHGGGWWNYFVDDFVAWCARHNVGNILGPVTRPPT